MNKPKIIGLTGGIGSGKSTIANHFLSHGIPVYFADDEAKLFYNNSEVLNLIKDKLGEDLVQNQILDKKKLAKLVFEDSSKLKILNNIIHPLVKIHFENWLKEHSNFPFVIKEAAILFESGSYKQCDKIICVIAPLKDRIQRVIKRDNTTIQEVQSRINNQWNDEQRKANSDFIITNINVSDALLQADDILKKLKNL